MNPMRFRELTLCFALAASALTIAPNCAAQDQRGEDSPLLDAYYENRETEPLAAYEALLEGYRAGSDDIRVPLELGYYQLEQDNYAQALTFFRAAAAIDPARKDIQDQIGYINVQLADHRAALVAFDRSLAIDPSDETIGLQRAYILQRLGREREAADSFHALSGSANGRIANQSCAAYRVLYDSVDRAFAAPWFGETYFAPQYVSHFDLAVFPFQGRIGAVLDADSSLEAYVSVRATADTRSGRGTFGPQNYYDNSAVVAAGLRAQPFDSVPVVLFVEAGGAYDLTDRGRDRWRGDVRGGAVVFKEWNMAPSCLADDGNVRPIADFYAETIYYSRYDDNLLFFARARPGLRVLESEHAALDLYVHAATGFDTRGVVGNDYQELGGGIAGHLFDVGGLTLRAEGVRVFRHDGLDSYTTFRVGIEHAIRF